MVKAYQNCWLGFNARNLKFPKVIEVLKIVSADKILVESDGMINPKEFGMTLKQVGEIRGWKLEKTKKITKMNALKWLDNQVI